MRDALLDLDRTRRGRDDRLADAEVLPEFEGLAGSPPRAVRDLIGSLATASAPELVE